MSGERAAQVENLPLSGLRVVECRDSVAGAYCARLLADGGAEVIKVEAPDGDSSRRRGPFPADRPHSERSGLFHALNINKLGITLDVRRPSGKRLLLALLREADVFVEGFPPRVAARLGLDYRSVHAQHPRLIVTSVTPFGQRGPYRDLRADEPVVYSLGGLSYATPGLPDHVEDPAREPPLRATAPVADIITGVVAAVATLTAVRSWRRDGLGRQVDVAGMQAVAAMLNRDMMAYSYSRTITGRLPIQIARMPNAVLPAKDGWVIIAAPYQHLWERFVGLMGHPDWADLEVFKDGQARADNWDALEPLLREWTMQHTAHQVQELGQAAGLPFFAVHSVGEMVDSRHTKVRGALWDAPMPGGLRGKVPGAPFHFSATPLKVRRPAPQLGQHNEEVFCGRLGIPREDLPRLAAAGVI